MGRYTFHRTYFLFRSILATIYNQSQFAERKHVARYWSINTAVTAVPLSAHPSPLVITTKLAAAILGGPLFGGGVLPAQYCPCGKTRMQNGCQWVPGFSVCCRTSYASGQARARSAFNSSRSASPFHWTAFANLAFVCQPRRSLTLSDIFLVVSM